MTIMRIERLFRNPPLEELKCKTQLWQQKTLTKLICFPKTLIMHGEPLKCNPGSR